MSFILEVDEVSQTLTEDEFLIINIATTTLSKGPLLTETDQKELLQKKKILSLCYTEEILEGLVAKLPDKGLLPCLKLSF